MQDGVSLLQEAEQVKEATCREEAAILACWFPGPVIPDKINHRQPSDQAWNCNNQLLGFAKLHHQLLTFFL